LDRLNHLVLLVLRAVATFKARAWRRFLPGGELTFSVSVKFLRQEPLARDAEPVGSAVQITTI